MTRVVLTKPDIDRALKRIAHEIVESQRGRTLTQALADFDTRQGAKLQSLSEADYVRSILAGLDTNGTAIDAVISGALKGWTLARL